MRPNLRSAARAQTIGTVLRSVCTGVIWTFAFIYILGVLGLNLGPLLAGAGVAGVALGFGAQSLVKDFLSGTFMLIEDQFGVGDVVDLGEASGVGRGREPRVSPASATRTAPCGTCRTDRSCAWATSPSSGHERCSTSPSPATPTSVTPTR